MCRAAPLLRRAGPTRHSNSVLRHDGKHTWQGCRAPCQGTPRRRLQPASQQACVHAGRTARVAVHAALTWGCLQARPPCLPGAGWHQGRARVSTRPSGAGWRSSAVSQRLQAAACMCGRAGGAGAGAGGRAGGGGPVGRRGAAMGVGWAIGRLLRVGARPGGLGMQPCAPCKACCGGGGSGAAQRGPARRLPAFQPHLDSPKLLWTAPGAAFPPVRLPHLQGASLRRAGGPAAANPACGAVNGCGEGDGTCRAARLRRDAAAHLLGAPSPTPRPPGRPGGRAMHSNARMARCWGRWGPQNPDLAITPVASV